MCRKFSFIIIFFIYLHPKALIYILFFTINVIFIQNFILFFYCKFFLFLKVKFVFKLIIILDNSFIQKIFVRI